MIEGNKFFEKFHRKIGHRKYQDLLFCSETFLIVLILNRIFYLFIYRFIC